jgi:hypothetical protein
MKRRKLSATRALLWAGLAASFYHPLDGKERCARNLARALSLFFLFRTRSGNASPDKEQGWGCTHSNTPRAQHALATPAKIADPFVRLSLPLGFISATTSRSP